MTSTRKGYRSGVALITALVLTGASMIVLGGVLGYVSNASRMTGYYESKNICRLAAQSEIELAKAAINFQFENSLNRSARIIGGDSFGASASSYDWFEAYSGATAKKTIGKAMGSRDFTLTLADSVTNNGCIVKVRIGRVDHTVGEQWATVTLVAEATRPGRGGATAKTIIEETIRFAQQRSKVFNNAYFVNNYGWFEGGGSTYVNGDIRSNADMKVVDSATINGRIFAAKNPELGATGKITATASNIKMDKWSDYKRTTYGVDKRARPLERDPDNTTINKGGYAVSDSITTKEKSDRLHPYEDISVEMPYIGDLSSSESDYRAWAQELHDADPNMCTIKQGGATLVTVYYDHAGPSGQATMTYQGKEVVAPDYGAIKLIGTANKPIEINGPVIIPSDVIIKGYVKGQGTIYSGRNIHIIGDIKYVNPPEWNNKSSAGANNSTKDLLGLMAKGNIVLGNLTGGITDSSRLGNCLTDSKNYVKPYECDTSDASIGYPTKFNDKSNSSTFVKYTGEEKVSKSVFETCQNAGLADFVPGGCVLSSGNYKFGKIKETTSYGWGWSSTTLEPSYNRKYYDTVCANSVIKDNADSKISQIDAVLYNNHGLFGFVGSCTFNGSIVCRNEGIIYGCNTTGGRIGGNLIMNWDIRLYSGSSETVSNDKVGLAKSSDNPPEVLDWRELPEGVITID